jgi:hypothetical protein
MKTLLALLMMTTLANAQFRTDNPETPNDEPNLECTIVKAGAPGSRGGRDDDPVRKINVWIRRAEGDGHLQAMEVFFTMRSGLRHYRSDQYTGTTLSERNKSDVQWTGWHDGVYFTRGHLFFNTSDSRWHYDEYQTKNSQNTMWMTSVCHETEDGQ